MSKLPPLDDDNKVLLLKNILNRTRLNKEDPNYLLWAKKYDNNYFVGWGANLSDKKTDQHGFHYFVPKNNLLIKHKHLGGFSLKITSNENGENPLIIKISSPPFPFERVFTPEYRYLKRIYYSITHKVQEDQKKAKIIEKEDQRKREEERNIKIKSLQDTAVRNFIDSDLHL